MANKKIPTAPKNAPKVKSYTESKGLTNPPKGYKKKSDNQPDLKKVKDYYSKKK